MVVTRSQADCVDLAERQLNAGTNPNPPAQLDTPRSPSEALPPITAPPPHVIPTTFGRIISHRTQEQTNTPTTSTGAVRRTEHRPTVAFDLTDQEPRRSPAPSRCSSSTALRIRQAEREAEERMLQLSRKELEIEKQMVRAQLATQIATLEAEGSQRGSIMGDPEPEPRIQSWLDDCAANTATQPFGSTPRPAHPSEQRPTEPRRTRSPAPAVTRERSASSGRGIAQLAQAIERMARQRPPPRQVYELPTFSGAAGEWLPFQAAYNESTAAYNFTPLENMARLRACLKGAAREVVLSLLHTATDAAVVMQTLRQCYGRPEVVVDKAISDLKKIPRVGTSAAELNTFAVKIQNIVTVLSTIRNRGYLYNPLLARDILEKMTPHLRSRYCDYAVEQTEMDEPEVIVLSRFLMREADRALRYTYTSAPTAATSSQPTRRPDSRAPPRPAAASSAPHRPIPVYAFEPEDACLCCGGSHGTPQCRKLLEMSVSARWEWAKEHRICFRCLSRKHRRDQCRAKKCDAEGCPHTHHRLLHNDLAVPRYQASPPRAPAPRTLAPAPRISAPALRTEPPPEAPASHEEPTEAAFTTATIGATVLLKVVPVTVAGPSGSVDTYALLDEGSTISIIDEDLAQQIGATGTPAPLWIKGVGSTSMEATSQRVEATIFSANREFALNAILRTVKNLRLHQQTVSRQDITGFKHLEGIHDVVYDAATPRLLIGADYWYASLPRETRVGRQNEPAALRTDLGWVVYGTAPRHIKNQSTAEASFYTTVADEELHTLVKRHFELDALGIALKNKKSPKNERAENIFKQTIKKTNGQYEVGQLRKDDHPQLPPSYQMAVTRLRGIERKMDRDPVFAEAYSQQMANLLEKGYAEPANVEVDHTPQWYLPHFAVKNPNKPGKVRLVFDAAAKTGGVSLNDHLLEGPDLLQSLPGILMRFREGTVAVTADIEEMFLRIKIRNKDQYAQMFLWRGRDRSAPPTAYKMTSMIFGAASSPYLAHSVRNHNAQTNAQLYPEAVEDISKNHYMDDLVASYATEAEAIQKAKAIADSHAIGGFNLRGWNSNSRKLIENTPQEKRAQGPSHLGATDHKILGLKWDTEDDTLGFSTSLVRVPEDVKTLLRGPTKREALSTVMSLYDPLGLISPYTITAKILLQNIWALKIGWDELLPQEEASDFASWLQGLSSVATLRIPRCYSLAGEAAELHVFTDASEQAYSAAAYWRRKDGHTVLIVAKAKVAPMKRSSIPRLELQAALIGARLVECIRTEHRIKPHRTFHWTDSCTVLHWVREDARRYSAFVAHRLGEIAEITEPNQWRWVPTKENPADDATRADYDRQLTATDRWYTGPAFLRLPEAEWPQEPTTLPAIDEEATEVCTHTTSSNTSETWLPDASRFSKFERLIRATARALYFIDRCRKRATQLELRHLTEAEQHWMRRSQEDSFAEELKILRHGGRVKRGSRLYKLDPVLGADGAIRMRGRLNAAPAPELSKRPVILDGRHHFVRLIVAQAHERAAHSSNERVVNDLRQRYWVLHLRPTVRTVAHACRLCRLRRARPDVPAMGDLPLARIEPYQRAFTHCGLDYFGPITVTIGRRHEKRWVALFTCLATRAVHLEVAASLTTDSAIMALRRMASQRGWPLVMYSDNGTNMRGADAELRAACAEWAPALRDYALLHRMEWRFIPPGAPNQGGAWERMVRSIKTALRATLHTKAPKEEVLNTLLAEAEATVNARPLTHVSVDPQDNEALTPNHFLLGGPANTMITGPCEEVDRRTWRASQALADYFWSRWVREYLPTLAPRQSPSGTERPLKTGDLVVVDATLPRNVWPRGVIEAVYPGPDGGIRSADVRTRGGVFRRPTTKLAVLPINNEASPRDSAGGRM